MKVGGQVQSVDDKIGGDCGQTDNPKKKLRKIAEIAVWRFFGLADNVQRKGCQNSHPNRNKPAK